MDHFQLRGGELWCEDVPLKAIAEGVGTPVYVYSTATMVRHAEVMQAAIAGCGEGEPLVAYAVKANPNPAVLATLARAGLGADVVSIGEYVKARAAGVPAERIVFSGVGKTREEIVNLVFLPLGTGGTVAFVGRNARHAAGDIGFLVEFQRDVTEGSEDADR